MVAVAVVIHQHQEAILLKVAAAAILPMEVAAAFLLKEAPPKEAIQVTIQVHHNNRAHMADMHHHQAQVSEMGEYEAIYGRDWEQYIGFFRLIYRNVFHVPFCDLSFNDKELVYLQKLIVLVLWKSTDL